MHLNVIFFYWTNKSKDLTTFFQGSRLRLILKYHSTTMAAITVQPADKASFAYSCMQKRPMGQYNGKCH